VGEAAVAWLLFQSIVGHTPISTDVRRPDARNFEHRLATSRVHHVLRTLTLTSAVTRVVVDVPNFVVVLEPSDARPRSAADATDEDCHVADRGNSDVRRMNGKRLVEICARKKNNCQNEMRPQAPTRCE
jgi:hypothetical protein